MNLRQILEGCLEFLKVHKTFTEKKSQGPLLPLPFPIFKLWIFYLLRMFLIYVERIHGHFNFFLTKINI